MLAAAVGIRAPHMAKAAPPPPNRAAKFVRKPPPRKGMPRWLMALILLVAILGALHFYIVNRIDRTVNFVSEMASGMVSITHRGGYYTWDGNLGIRKLRIESGADSNVYLAIDKVELDTPGWGWVFQLLKPNLGFGFGKNRAMRAATRAATRGDDDFALPDAAHLALKLEGFQFDITSLLPPGMPSVGFSSGALFETEGCTNSRYWVPLNLTNDLGLPFQRVDLAMGFSALEGNRVLESYELASPGLSRMRFEREVQTSAPQAYLTEGVYTAKAKVHRWVVEDEGFLAARNRYCSEQSKVDEDEFLRRHLTAARRVLQAFGVQPSPETEVVYADFVRKGGKLEVEAKPTLEIDAAVLSQYEPAQIWEIYNAKIRHNDGALQPMGIEFVPAKPLPNAYSGSVYDLIARNDATEDAATTPAAPLGDRFRAMVPKAPVEVEPDAETVPEPAPEPVKPPTTPAPPPRPQPVPIALDTPSLIVVIGERVQVTTNDGKSRIGILSAVDPKVISMTVKVGGGNAELSFARERLVSVEVNPRGR
jgi:hypothetical protein